MLGAALWAQAPAAQPPAAGAALAPAAPDPIVFTAGGETMTRSQFERLLANLPQQVRTQAATPDGKRQLADKLADMKILAQEARSRGLQSTPDIASQIKMQEDSLLANAMYSQLVQTAKPSEIDVKAAYEARKAELEQVKARHILVRVQGSRIPLRKDQKELTDAEALAKAKALRERIVKGEDFAAVAKAESDDTTTAAKGGELGTLSRGRMIPEFEHAVFALKAGEISEPVKTAYGYHLIQVQERITPDFDKVRGELERDLQNQAATQTVRALREKATVKFNPDYFGAPEASPAAAAPAAPIAPGTPAVKK
jgi:peptidyl-prolyl cis-trans isomerase C